MQEAIYSLLMLNNDFICESAHIDELDPAFADMPIVRKRIDNAGPVSYTHLDVYKRQTSTRAIS